MDQVAWLEGVWQYKTTLSSFRPTLDAAQSQLVLCQERNIVFVIPQVLAPGTRGFEIREIG